jgi:hypothetical protein
MLPDAIKEFSDAWPFFDCKHAVGSDMNFNIIALAQLQRLDDSGRQTNRQAVSPFCNLHD